MLDRVESVRSMASVLAGFTTITVLNSALSDRELNNSYTIGSFYMQMSALALFTLSMQLSQRTRREVTKVYLNTLGPKPRSMLAEDGFRSDREFFYSSMRLARGLLYLGMTSLLWAVAMGLVAGTSSFIPAYIIAGVFSIFILFSHLIIKLFVWILILHGTKFKKVYEKVFGDGDRETIVGLGEKGIKEEKEEKRVLIETVQNERKVQATDVKKNL